MAVTAESTISTTSIRNFAVVVGVLVGFAFYLYGPPVTPVMQAAAVATCNKMTGGDYRNYELRWALGTEPHWVCLDRNDPGAGAIDLGWWVTPGR